MPTCLTPSAEITAIDTGAGTSDLTTLYTARYRLESDPDVDASYTPVTTTKTTMGITFPYFDISAVGPETYVLHTYLTSDGTGTGTKMTFVVECEDEA